jgi:hypothetical protein
MLEKAITNMRLRILDESYLDELLTFLATTSEDSLSLIRLRNHYKGYYLNQDIKDSFIVADVSDFKIMSLIFVVIRNNELVVKGLTPSKDFSIKQLLRYVIFLKTHISKKSIKNVINIIVDSTIFNLQDFQDVANDMCKIEETIVKAGEKLKDKQKWLNLLNRTTFVNDISIFKIVF